MKPCLFCAIAQKSVPATIVYEDADTVAFLDSHPLFKGHTLIVPREHVVTIVDLPSALLAPFHATVQRAAKAVMSGLGADGVFVANNNVVSQSVPHLHVHVVPRHKKDGLRGFFWPRAKYASDEEREDFATRLRTAMRG